MIVPRPSSPEGNATATRSKIVRVTKQNACPASSSSTTKLLLDDDDDDDVRTNSLTIMFKSVSAAAANSV